MYWKKLHLISKNSYSLTLDIRIIRCDFVYDLDHRCNLHELKWNRLNVITYSIKEVASLNTTFFIASHDITK